MELNLEQTKNKPIFKSGDPNNLVLIDGSGYIFRAFYGLPPMNNIKQIDRLRLMS